MVKLHREGSAPAACAAGLLNTTWYLGAHQKTMRLVNFHPEIFAIYWTPHGSFNLSSSSVPFRTWRLSSPSWGCISSPSSWVSSSTAVSSCPASTSSSPAPYPSGREVVATLYTSSSFFNAYISLPFVSRLIVPLLYLPAFHIRTAITYFSQSVLSITLGK